MENFAENIHQNQLQNKSTAHEKKVQKLISMRLGILKT